MRTRPPAVIIGVAAGIITAAVGLTGCGASKNTTPTSTSKGATVQLEIGNTINYGSLGTTAEVDCAGGKSLNVGGSNNTLTVKGTCESVNVLGADNKITVAKIVKSLTITGLNNTVTYKSGAPNVDDHGSDNTVNKR
ncbi:MAG: DUF3060 domain-containing protein [Mycobacterium sp.]